MTKGKDKQPLYLVRKGLSLVPHMEMDADVIAAIPEGTPVRVEIKQPRFGPRHRAYWYMLNECVKATGCALSANVLHMAVKLETGHVELVRLNNGLTVAVPGSIAFDKMSESDMVLFFEAAKEYLAREHGYWGQDNNSIPGAVVSSGCNAPDQAGADHPALAGDGTGESPSPVSPAASYGGIRT